MTSFQQTDTTSTSSYFQQHPNNFNDSARRQAELMPMLSPSLAKIGVQHNVPQPPSPDIPLAAADLYSDARKHGYQGPTRHVTLPHASSPGSSSSTPQGTATAPSSCSAAPTFRSGPAPVLCRITSRRCCEPSALRPRSA